MCRFLRETANVMRNIGGHIADSSMAVRGSTVAHTVNPGEKVKEELTQIRLLKSLLLVTRRETLLMDITEPNEQHGYYIENVTKSYNANHNSLGYTCQKFEN